MIPQTKYFSLKSYTNTLYMVENCVDHGHWREEIQWCDIKYKEGSILVSAIYMFQLRLIFY